ncbi:hypothetical protein AX16_006332 [Volvariella volvacea WC 439]|nr:hypothetical protein AX16_006332 [Volvariella volvacea WC 439]
MSNTDATAQARNKLDSINKKDLTILLVGKTGAGRTSFMSLLVNLFQEIGPLELKDMHDQSKESGLDHQSSQTTKATLYTFTSSDGTKLRILDTPGFANTRGINMDNQNKAEINRVIKEFVTSIDAVVIVANGSPERLGVEMNYSLNILTSMFPSSIIDNIGFIFTCSDALTFNFKMDDLQPELRECKYWPIQNPLALYKNYESQVKQGVPERVLKVHRRKLEDNYDETVETLNEFMKWLDERKLQPVNEINNLYEMSISIESKIDAVLLAITRLTERRSEMNKVKLDLDNTIQSIVGLKELKRKQESPIWDRQSSDNLNTICIAPNCYKNCHSPCSEMNFANDPVDLGRKCWAFHESPTPSDGDAARRCRVCDHEASLHRHYYHVHVLRSREIDPQTKKELEHAETREETLRVAEDFLQKELMKISEDMEKAQEDVRRLIDGHNKIALRRDFAGYIRSVIAMLEFRKEELKSKPHTENELRLVDENIATFKRKLSLLKMGGKGV